MKIAICKSILDGHEIDFTCTNWVEHCFNIVWLLCGTYMHGLDICIHNFYVMNLEATC